MIELDLFGIPKGCQNKDEAIDFIRFASSSSALADMVGYLPNGPTAFLLGITISGFGEYLWNVIPMGLWINGEPDNQWQSWWTNFIGAGGLPDVRLSACSSLVCPKGAPFGSFATVFC